MRTTISALFVGGLAWGDQTRADDFSWVEKRVEEREPKPGERKFDQIGWAADIRAGLALAEKHDRPFFLFTHDGRMARGRC
jgi:hypothetical protein